MAKVKTFFGKVKGFFKKSADKIAMCMAAPVSAITMETTGTEAVDVSGMLESIKGLFSDFTVGNLVLIIGAALGIGIVFFLFWFAYRFIKRQAVKGIKRGGL